MIIIIAIIIIITIIKGQKVAHQKATPQKSSWIFSRILQWTFGDIFQHIFIYHLYAQKDCHFTNLCDYNLCVSSGV